MKLIELFESTVFKENDEQDINKLIFDTSRSSGIKGRIIGRVVDHKDEITPASQLRLFMLFRPDPNEPLVKINLDEILWGPIEGQINGTIRTSGLSLLFMYDEGVFTNQMIKTQIQKIALDIYHAAIPLIKQYYIKSECINNGSNPLNYIKLAATVCGKESEFKKLVNNLVSEEYRRLEDEGRKLNNIQSKTDFNRALETHTKKIEQTLNKMM